jgi:hypothetical protein
MQLSYQVYLIVVVAVAVAVAGLVDLLDYYYHEFLLVETYTTSYLRSYSGMD